MQSSEGAQLKITERAVLKKFDGDGAFTGALPVEIVVAEDGEVTEILTEEQLIKDFLAKETVDA